MTLTAEPFGSLPDGSRVSRYTLSRAGGLTLRILTHGGIVQSLEVPDARGRVANVVLGFSSLQGYLTGTDPYFGALIGRFANRLATGEGRVVGGVREVLSRLVSGCGSSRYLRSSLFSDEAAPAGRGEAIGA
jgi:aldose 1-epimerase